MLLHWRFDTLPGFVPPTLPRLAFFAFWRFDRLITADDTKHVLPAALEIFGRGGSSHPRVRARWILHGDRVEPYRSILPTIGPGHSTWVLTKMKKVPERGLPVPGIPVLKIYSTDVRYWFFVSRLRRTFSRMLSPPPSLSLRGKKCGYVNEETRTRVQFVSGTCPLWTDGGYAPGSRYSMPIENRETETFKEVLQLKNEEKWRKVT